MRTKLLNNTYNPTCSQLVKRSSSKGYLHLLTACQTLGVRRPPLRRLPPRLVVCSLALTRANTTNSTNTCNLRPPVRELSHRPRRRRRQYTALVARHPPIMAAVAWSARLRSRCSDRTCRWTDNRSNCP